jgi:hypothetical protein
MVLKYPAKTGTIVELSLAGRPSKPEWSADKRRSLQRKKFGGTRGTNSRKASDAVEHILEIWELPLV